MFRKLITAPVVKIVYPVGALFILIDGIINCIYDIVSPLFGIIFIIVGNLMWRLWCELWIVVFDLHHDVKLLAAHRADPPIASVPEPNTDTLE
jgi:hypothetical protein